MELLSKNDDTPFRAGLSNRRELGEMGVEPGIFIAGMRGLEAFARFEGLERLERFN